MGSRSNRVTFNVLKRRDGHFFQADLRTYARTVLPIVVQFGTVINVGEGRVVSG